MISNSSKLETNSSACGLFDDDGLSDAGNSFWALFYSPSLFCGLSFGFENISETLSQNSTGDRYEVSFT
jgi:hypothetical protein